MMAQKDMESATARLHDPDEDSSDDDNDDFFPLPSKKARQTRFPPGCGVLAMVTPSNSNENIQQQQLYSFQLGTVVQVGINMNGKREDLFQIKIHNTSELVFAKKPELQFALGTPVWISNHASVKEQEKQAAIVMGSDHLPPTAENHLPNLYYSVQLLNGTFHHGVLPENINYRREKNHKDKMKKEASKQQQQEAVVHPPAEAPVDPPNNLEAAAHAGPPEIAAPAIVAVNPPNDEASISQITASPVLGNSPSKDEDDSTKPTCRQEGQEQQLTAEAPPARAASGLHNLASTQGEAAAAASSHLYGNTTASNQPKENFASSFFDETRTISSKRSHEEMDSDDYKHDNNRLTNNSRTRHNYHERHYDPFASRSNHEHTIKRKSSRNKSDYGGRSRLHVVVEPSDRRLLASSSLVTLPFILPSQLGVDLLINAILGDQGRDGQQLANVYSCSLDIQQDNHARSCPLVVLLKGPHMHSLVECQMAIEGALFRSVPREVRGYLLAMLGSMNRDYRTSNKCVVMTRDPHSNNSSQLCFLAMVHAGDRSSRSNRTVSFRVVDDCRERLERQFRCQIEIGGGHPDFRAVSRHVIITGSEYNSVYQCRDALQEYAWGEKYA